MRILAICIRQFFQKWHPCVQKNKLRRQMFCGKFRLFLSFPHFAQKPKITFDKSGFGKPVKNFLYSSRETFCWKHFFENLYKSYLFLSLGKKTSGTMLKLFFVSSGTLLEIWTFWGKSMFFCRFHTLCELFPQLQTKLAGLSS